MATFNHDFIPGDTVFVVTDGTCVDEGTVLQLTFITFLDSDGLVKENVNYIVMKKVDDTTVKVTPDYIYGTVDLALDHVKSEIITPTPSPSENSSPTPTPMVSPTPTPVP